MSDSPCSTCGGTERRVEMRVCAYAPGLRNVAHPVEVPCPSCCRIVSVEEASNAAAIAEIQREGLSVDNDVYADESLRWRVWRRPEGPTGRGPTLPSALANFRKASGK